MQFISPWITQLNGTYSAVPVSENLKSDVAIVGGGISGVCTAYFTLKNTDLNVVLIEGNKIAHAATGHNAGQLVCHFEKNTLDLIREFGLDLTIDAYSSVHSAWDLLDEIYKDTDLKTSYSQFIGYDGCDGLEQILRHLENKMLCRQAGIAILPVLIAKESEIATKIPEKFKMLYSLVPQKKILKLLEIQDKNYIAVNCIKKGCMNSALFCEELITYLLKKYSDRFALYENSHVKNISLEKSEAVLTVGEHNVTATKVVLCTNGYKNFSITNNGGNNIESVFKKSIRGLVGHMYGYLEQSDKLPTAIAYEQVRNYAGNDIYHADPYYYVTRRPYVSKEGPYNLVCIGGAETKLENNSEYNRSYPYSEEARISLQQFLAKNYENSLTSIKSFVWHGLLGYTQNGIRYIGADPSNSSLLYNLGCNGVGILPSIYGGSKISRILSGERQEKSIFDP
ncbi:hypothetical protein BH09PAT2_BH09PAT2_07240 [soil metagenome]